MLSSRLEIFALDLGSFFPAGFAIRVCLAFLKVHKEDEDEEGDTARRQAGQKPCQMMIVRLLHDGGVDERPEGGEDCIDRVVDA